MGHLVLSSKIKEGVTDCICSSGGKDRKQLQNYGLETWKVDMW
jgi:hypothetical protein